MYKIKVEYETTLFEGLLDKDIDDMLSRIGGYDRIGRRYTVTHTVDVCINNMIDDDFIEKLRLRVFDAMKKGFENFEKPVTVEKTIFIGIKSIKEESNDK